MKTQLLSVNFQHWVETYDLLICLEFVFNSLFTYLPILRSEENFKETSAHFFDLSLFGHLKVKNGSFILILSVYQYRSSLIDYFLSRCWRNRIDSLWCFAWLICWLSYYHLFVLLNGEFRKHSACKHGWMQIHL